MILKSASPRDTREIARTVAAALRSRRPGGQATVLSLIGDLGSGKTTFIKYLAAELGVKTRVSSPTFLLMRSFQLRDSRLPFRKLYHIDAYRLRDESELDALDFSKIISDGKNLLLIEWADKVKKSVPRNGINLVFRHGKEENERIIKINNLALYGKRKTSSLNRR